MARRSGERFTTDDLGEITRRYLAGESRLSLAREYGTKSETLTRYFEAAGIALRDPHVHRFTPDVEAEIAGRYTNGDSLVALGKEYICDQATIRKIARKRGLPKRRHGGQPRRFTPEDVAEMDRMARAGQSQRLIALHFDSSQITISRVMQQYEITPAHTGHARGERHQSWKGGRTTSRQGYTAVRLATDDPLAVMRNTTGYVAEHRLVMARYLGRPLYEWETVHHIDGNRAHNDLTNLQLRIGRHGKYAAYRCMDCGSTRLEPILLATQD